MATRGRGLDTSAVLWTRPERANGVSIVPGMRFCAATHVQPAVLRQVITLVQLDRLTSAEDELHLILKLDAASLQQRQRSHVVVLATTSLSSRVQVQRTSDLENLGSNKEVCRVHPLQLALCGSRCLYCGVVCT